MWYSWIIQSVVRHIHNTTFDEGGGGGGGEVREHIRASVDALCRDGTSEISLDPHTKCLQTWRECF